VIVVTGGLGFLGRSIVATLLDGGEPHIRCIVRPGTKSDALVDLQATNPDASIELYPASFDNRAELTAAVKDASVVYHAAAAKSGSHAAQVSSTVVASENFYQACVESEVQQFVLVSSFAVFGASEVKSGGVIDESVPIEAHPEIRDPYSFSKQRQEELALHYANEQGLPLVVVRPGVIFGGVQGPMSPRVGIDLFGIFLHLGRRNAIPLTYVDNCADAIVRAGKTTGALGEVICIVDDDLPTSSEILRRYQQAGASLRAVPVPRWLLYLLSKVNVRVSAWSRGQFPVVFKPSDIACYWTGHQYSNAKAKRLLNWSPQVSMHEALDRTFKMLQV